MDLWTFYDINIFAFILLLIIRANENGNFSFELYQHKLFLSLVNINLILIIVDILGWVFNGREGTVYFLLNQGSNLLLYLLEIIPSAIWVIYVQYQIYHDEKQIKRIKKTIGFIILLNAVISMASLYTGWFFSVDGNNFYHRGPCFGIHIFLCLSLLCYSFVLTLANRKRLEKRYFWALVLYFAMMLTGSSLQSLFYGLTLNWICMAIALLIIYLKIQERGLKTDYLTEAYNRRQLDIYIQHKIKSSTRDKTFSALIIDLDDFKHINDTFGHMIGDDVLIEVVRLLKNALRNSDMIARYGGDEFCVIIDSDDPDTLQSIVGRIQKDVSAFNSNQNKQYTLGLSIGYDIYDYESGMTADDFMKHIDQLMYVQKRSVKPDRSAN